MKYKRKLFERELKLKLGLSLFFALIINVSMSAQSLRRFLVEAEKNSPALKRIQLEVEQTLEAENEVGSLPNTLIDFGYFLSETETRVGPQRARAGISQSFPWFGALKAKRESVIYESNAKADLFNHAKRELFFKIKIAYYQLYAHRRRHTVVTEHIETVKLHEKSALQALETGKASAVDVLKIDIEKKNLEEQLKRHENLGEASKINFNILLNREEDVEIMVPLDQLIDLNLLKYNKHLIANNPKLVQYDNLGKSVEKLGEAAKKEGLPEIKVGLDYVLVEELPQVGLIDNGKDIIIPKVQLSLPLFSKKYKAKEKRLKIKKEELMAMKEEVENELKIAYELVYSKLTNAVNAINTYRESIKQVVQTEKLLLATYETGNVDFNAIIDIQKLKLEYEFKLIDAEYQFFEQRSIIELITQD